MRGLILSYFTHRRIHLLKTDQLASGTLSSKLAESSSTFSSRVFSLHRLKFSVLEWGKEKI